MRKTAGGTQMGNRVVKFRGKRVDNGEWVFGDYGKFHKRDGDWTHEIHCPIPKISGSYWNEVIQETVGQYTGLKDKDGTEIFEGDIVNNGERVRYSTGQEKWFGGVGVVRYDTKNGCLVINNDDGITKRLTVKVIKNNRVQVIGTIHDKVSGE